MIQPWTGLAKKKQQLSLHPMTWFQKCKVEERPDEVHLKQIINRQFVEFTYKEVQ